jgi:hypothetical protein
MSAVVEACLSAKGKTGLNHRLSFQKGGKLSYSKIIVEGGLKLEYHRQRQFFGLSITL